MSSDVAQVIARDLEVAKGPARAFTPFHLWNVRLKAAPRLRERANGPDRILRREP